MFMEFLGTKVPPKSTVFFFYKRLQKTIVNKETMWTTLMNELNNALDNVISEYKEEGFELEVSREKTTNSRTTT